MKMIKENLIKEALKNIEGFKPNSEFLILLIDLRSAKVLTTSNFSIVDNANWDFAFVYHGVHDTSVESDLFIFDTNSNIINTVEVEGWKLILENQISESYTHQFIICDPSKGFLEKKYKIYPIESRIKELIFNQFIPLTKYKSLSENAMDKKLDYIIELLESKNMADAENGKSIPKG